jgi:hypothetical protein
MDHGVCRETAGMKSTQEHSEDQYEEYELFAAFDRKSLKVLEYTAT